MRVKVEKETLFIEFTEKQELEVYDRLQRAVDGEWNKLEQQSQIERSSKLQSRKDVEKRIAIRALDRFLTPLPAKARLEKETGQKISDDLWERIVKMDGEHRKEELITMCREKGLPISGDKKSLAKRLLGYEHKI